MKRNGSNGPKSAAKCIKRWRNWRNTPGNSTYQQRCTPPRCPETTPTDSLTDGLLSDGTLRYLAIIVAIATAPRAASSSSRRSTTGSTPLAPNNSTLARAGARARGGLALHHAQCRTPKPPRPRSSPSLTWFTELNPGTRVRSCASMKFSAYRNSWGWVASDRWRQAGACKHSWTNAARLCRGYRLAVGLDECAGIRAGWTRRRTYHSRSSQSAVGSSEPGKRTIHPYLRRHHRSRQPHRESATQSPRARHGLHVTNSRHTRRKRSVGSLRRDSRCTKFEGLTGRRLRRNGQRRRRLMSAWETSPSATLSITTNAS